MGPLERRLRRIVNPISTTLSQWWCGIGPLRQVPVRPTPAASGTSEIQVKAFRGVPSPGQWHAPGGLRPGWQWLPENGAMPNLRGIPRWVRVWYRTPLVDRYAYEWIGWESRHRPGSRRNGSLGSTEAGGTARLRAAGRVRMVGNTAVASSTERRIDVSAAGQNTATLDICHTRHHLRSRYDARPVRGNSGSSTSRCGPNTPATPSTPTATHGATNSDSAAVRASPGRAGGGPPVRVARFRPDDWCRR
jgi:hypothetical protein